MARAERHPTSTHRTGSPGGSPAGFTLLEIAVILAIIGILASLAVAGLESMKTRAAFTSNAGEIITGLRKTQAAAAGSGNYTAFVVDTSSKEWWGVEAASDFDLSTFNPDGGAPKVLVKGRLDPNVNFADGGYGAALPAPFASVDTSNPCSFCDTGAHHGFVLFEPGGKARFSNVPDAGVDDVAQQFTIRGQIDQTTRTVSVAVVGETGLIETFEK